MRMGLFDRRITFLRAATTRDALNAPTVAWSEPITKAWARRLKGEVSETDEAGQMVPQVQSTWHVRWSSKAATVTANDRFAFGGRQYRIIGIDEIDRRKTLEITAVTTADQEV